jgi:hypothetical protein
MIDLLQNSGDKCMFCFNKSYTFTLSLLIAERQQKNDLVFVSRMQNDFIAMPCHAIIKKKIRIYYVYLLIKKFIGMYMSTLELNAWY